MSVPAPPVKVLFPEFPVRVLSDVLPVPFISLDPVRVRFSTLEEISKLTEASTKSAPSESNSVTDHFLQN